MPRPYIILRSGSEAWLVEWSTVVDAPVAYGIPIAEVDRNDERVARALKNGTSYIKGPNRSGELEACFNRAGEDETTLTVDQLIDVYCRNGESVTGFPMYKHNDDEVNAFYEEQHKILESRGLDKATNFLEQGQNVQ